MPSDPRAMNAPIIEGFTPARACLVGSVMTSGPLGQPLSQTSFSQLQASRSLKLVHGFGLVSSQIRSAMLQKTILPKVEITTPNAKVTLVNAQVVNIDPYRPPAEPKHHHPKGGVANEGTLVSFSFQKIDITWIKHSKANVDSWNAFP
jgi:hypothetical protein